MRKTVVALCLLWAPLWTAAQPSRPTGSWVDRRDGEWALSLFADYAVWQGRTWDYRRVCQQGDDWFFVMQSGGKETELRMSCPTDTTLSVRPDGGDAVLLQPFRPDRCPFPVAADERPFEPFVEGADSATLAGCFAGEAGMFVRLVHDWLNPEMTEWQTRTDSLGRFCFRLQTEVPLYARLVCKRQVLPVVILPGKRLYCHVDCRGEQDVRMAMGAAAHLVTEGWHYGRPADVGLYFDATDHLSDAAFEQMLDSSLTDAQNRLVAYEDRYPTLSLRFRRLSRETLRFSALAQIMQRRFVHRGKADPALSASLMDRVDSLLAPPISVPLSLVTDASLFMTDLLGYHTDLRNHTSAGMIHPRYLRQAFDELVGFEQPDSARQLLDSLVCTADRVRRTPKTDSVQLCRYEELVTATVRLLQSPAAASVQMDVWKSMNYRAQREVLDSLPLHPALRDYGAALLACDMMAMDHTPLPRSLRDEAVQAIHSPAMRRHVERLDSQYGAAVHALAGASLMSNAALEGLTDGRAILDRLLEPYRGSVVYVDVWGSWCGPCKQDMRRYGPILKQQFRGKPVVFLYLANRTSDASWRSVVSEYGCYGPQVVHYNLPAAQQEALEQVLGVTAYPHYSLFGPDGRLAAAQAPSPSATDELTVTIKKLITTQK